MRKAGFALLAVCLLETPAKAEPEPEPKPLTSVPAPATETRWYGWQTLLASYSGLLLTVGTESPGSKTPWNFYAGATLYFTGAPIVHLAHRQYDKAVLSLGLHVGTPLVLGLLGAGRGALAEAGTNRRSQIDDGGDSISQTSLGLAYGMVAGLLLGPILDATLVAKEPVKKSTVSLSPTVSTTRVGTKVWGLAGVF